MGTNPLPDFVVADYFIKTNKGLKDIYLIYSEETKEQKSTKVYAENLRELLKKRYQDIKVSFSLVPLSNISFAEDIRKDIQKGLIPKIPPGSSIHLNYTGGTKAIGIHSYRTIEDSLKENRFTDASFSYLDARSFRLIDDRKGAFTTDLRELVHISFKELIELHGYQRTNEDSPFKFTESLHVFKELIDKGELKRYFEAYRRENFCKKDTQTLIEKKKEITEELRNMKATEPLLSIVLALPEEYRIFNADGTFREPSTNEQIKKTIKFLDGQWLEQYIYELIKKEESFKDYEVEINCEITRPDWGLNRFELDVSILKGYQLVGLSCTTSHDRKICKSKGFEILHRTKQIGGDEARAVLITRLEDAKKDGLRDELEIDTGGKENILVLGEEDLKKDIFIDMLQEFIG